MGFVSRSIYVIVSLLVLSLGHAFAEGEKTTATEAEKPVATEAEKPSAPSVIEADPKAVENNGFSTEDYSFGDWDVRCVLQKVRDENNKDTGKTRLLSCATQKPFSGEGVDQIILMFGLSYEVVEGKVKPYPSAYFQAPLGVFLEPVYLKIGKEKPYVAPYRVCSTRGCTAGLVFNESIYTNFKSGEKAEIGFVLDPNRDPYRFSVSLKGFTAATGFMKKAMENAGKEITKADLDALAK